MGKISFELFISKIANQIDGNVDLDCSIYVEPVNEDNVPLGDGFDVDASVSLTDALDAIFHLYDGGDYTPEELMSAHKTLSIINGKTGSLMKLLEDRLGVDFEKEGN